MSPPTQAPPAPEPTRHQFLSPDTSALLAVVVLSTALAFGLSGLEPHRIDRLTIDNTTEYDLFVEVRGDGEGWMPVIISPRGRAAAAQHVIDQGDTWTFRFTGQGYHGGTAQYRRDTLISAGWRIEAGPAIQQQIASQGAEPSPPRS